MQQNFDDKWKRLKILKSIEELENQYLKGNMKAKK